MEDRFYMVGMGASAGGHAALKEFFKHIPAQVNAAFVVVMHLSREYRTNLHAILGWYTALPVSLVEHGRPVERGRVYVMPENVEVTVQDGRLFLNPRATIPVNKAVDIFFRSLANDMRTRAIAVVLSGGGTDGAAGVKDIYQQGGKVFIQAPASSAVAGMPKASIAADHPEAVADPAALATLVVEATRA